ncbi:MAG: hypothetical protein L0Y75_10400 [Acidobacteria bacterium]|nr:hypothetical protein [Acidobacteriota bacterium]
MESVVRFLGREAIVLVVIAGLCGLSLTVSLASGGFGFILLLVLIGIIPALGGALACVCAMLLIAVIKRVYLVLVGEATVLLAIAAYYIWFTEPGSRGCMGWGGSNQGLIVYFAIGGALACFVPIFLSRSDNRLGRTKIPGHSIRRSPSDLSNKLGSMHQGEPDRSDKWLDDFLQMEQLEKDEAHCQTLCRDTFCN